MKKDSDILIFSLLYIIIFTFTYIFIYYDLEAFIFLLIIVCAYSFPCLIAVLSLLFVERRFKLKVHSIIYLVLSIMVFYISFMIWNSDGYNNKNLYPSISAKIHVAILYSILSHVLAYFSLQIINYIKKKHHAV